MLVNVGTKVVLVTPPRCGSTVCHHVLAARGWIWVIGPVGSDWTQTQHTTEVPHDFGGYECWMLVREGLPRWVSLYKHQMKYGWPLDGVESFDDFILKALTSDHWFLRGLTWYSSNIMTVVDGERIKVQVSRFVELKDLGVEEEGNVTSWEPLDSLVENDRVDSFS